MNGEQRVRALRFRAIFPTFRHAPLVEQKEMRNERHAIFLLSSGRSRCGKKRKEKISNVSPRIFSMDKDYSKRNPIDRISYAFRTRPSTISRKPPYAMEIYDSHPSSNPSQYALTFFISIRGVWIHSIIVDHATSNEERDLERRGRFTKTQVSLFQYFQLIHLLFYRSLILVSCLPDPSYLSTNIKKKRIAVVCLYDR